MVERARDRRCAFTLAELLVVLGVIGVLVGILLPAVSRARGAAARVACAATLRQWGMANQMYVTEFRDWYLPVKWGFEVNPAPPWSPPPAGLAPPTIAHLTYPNNLVWRRYLIGKGAAKGTARVPYGLICPRAVLAVEGRTKAGYDAGRSYGYNSTGLGWYKGPTIYYTGWKRGRVRSPALKLMFVDATDWVVSQAGSGRWEQWGEAWSPPPVRKTGITAYRHRGGANVAYWDGHVAWVGKGEVMNNARLWNVGK